MTKEQILKERLGEGWYNLLSDFFDSDYMNQLRDFIDTAYRTKTVAPKSENIFRAFKVTPLEDLQLIIIGSEPSSQFYPNGEPISTGLALAVDNALYITPGLKNVFDSLEENVRFGLYLDRDTTLECYTKQGILLLNYALTVEKNKPGSHTMYWKKFIEEVTRRISLIDKPLVFMLWGQEARKLEYLINKDRHLVLIANHPSSVAHTGDKWLSVADHWEAARGWIYRTSKGERTIKW